MLVSAASYSSSWISPDPRAASRCVCNPRPAPTVCGSAYQALSSGVKEDHTSIDSIFPLLNLTVFLLKNLILRMIYPIKKEMALNFRIKTIPIQYRHG